MKVLVLGATGGIGQLLIEKCLVQGHEVVVYARSPEKLPDTIARNEKVSIHKGSLTDEIPFSNALAGVHAVVSALGPAVSKGPLHPSNTPLAKAYSLLLRLMRERDVKRLICLGTASNKDDHDKHSIIFEGLVLGVDLFAHSAYKDVVEIGKVVRESNEVLWTLARVPVLTSGQSITYHAGYIGDGKTSAHLTRNAFAEFVVTELAKNEWIQKSPLISSV